MLGVEIDPEGKRHGARHLVADSGLVLLQHQDARCGLRHFWIWRSCYGHAGGFTFRIDLHHHVQIAVDQQVLLYALDRNVDRMGAVLRVGWLIARLHRFVLALDLVLLLAAQFRIGLVRWNAEP